MNSSIRYVSRIFLVGMIVGCASCIRVFGEDMKNGANIPQADSLTLSLAFPGKKIVFFENFDALGEGTLKEIPKGAKISGKDFSITRSREINMHLSQAALMLKGEDEGSLKFQFPPISSGRVRVSLNVVQIEEGNTPDVELYLLDAKGNRGPLIRWDKDSKWPNGKATIAANGGVRYAFSQLTINKTAGKPMTWKHVQVGTLRILADLNTQKYVADGNLSAAISYYQTEITSAGFVSKLENISGLEIVVHQGSGELVLDNIKVEGPVFSNEEIEKIRLAKKVEATVPNIKEENSTPEQIARRTSSLENAIIWETNPMIDAPSGYDEYKNIVPMLKELGITMVYFVCQWHSTDYFPGGQLSYPLNKPREVAPGYGTIDEFKKCVRMLQSNGFKVMLDFGIHSAAWDSDVVREHPEWFTKLDGGPLVSRTPLENFIYMARFDIRRADVREYLIQSLSYWVDDVGVDALRIDLANHLFADRKPEATQMPWQEFWAECCKALRTKKPDLILLGESANRGMVRAGFDMEYDAFWRVRIRYLKRFIEKEKLPFGILSYAFSRDIPKEFPETRVSLLGLETHDFEPAATPWKGQDAVSHGFDSSEKARVLTSMCFTLPAVPILFSGEEYENRFVRLEKKNLSEQERSAFEFLRRLIKVREEAKLNEGKLSDVIPLTPGGNVSEPKIIPYGGKENEEALREYFKKSAYPDWLAYGRATSAGSYIICANYTSVPQNIHFDFSQKVGWEKASIEESVNLVTGARKREGIPVSQSRLLGAYDVQLLKITVEK